MSEEQYLKRLDAVSEKYQLGEYAFTGEYAQKVLKTSKGGMLLLELITGETEDALAPLLIARGPEVNALLRTVMEESFKRPRKAAPNA